MPKKMSYETQSHLPHANPHPVESCFYLKFCYFVHHGFFCINSVLKVSH